MTKHDYYVFNKHYFCIKSKEKLIKQMGGGGIGNLWSHPHLKPHFSIIQLNNLSLVFLKHSI